MTDAPTAVETRTAPKMLASAGGDHRTQLVHLKAHLAFQAQTKCAQARINWSTVITQAQSRRHITQALHEKINSKGPGFHAPGKVNTPDGQRRLESVVNHARHGTFFGGDGNVVLPWGLQYRIYRSTYPRQSDEAFWDLVGERRPVPVRPKEETFALELRVRLAEARTLRKKLEELLRNQGASPKRWRHAVLRTMRHCIICRQIYPVEEVQDDRCPGCGNGLNEHRTHEFACPPGVTPRLVPKGLAPESSKTLQPALAGIGGG